jgi:hypothetical protein
MTSPVGIGCVLATVPGRRINCQKYHLEFRVPEVPSEESSIQEFVNLKDFVNLKEQPVKATNTCLWDALHEAMIDAGIFEEADEPPKIKDMCFAYMKSEEFKKETNKELKVETQPKKLEISGGDHLLPPTSSASGGGAMNFTPLGSEAVSSVHSSDAKAPTPMPAMPPAPAAASTDKKFKIEFQNMEFIEFSSCDSVVQKAIGIADFYRVFLLRCCHIIFLRLVLLMFFCRRD